MIKQILAVAIVVALSACSDDTSDSVVDAATSGDTSGTTSDTGDTSGTTSDTGDTSGTTPDSGDTSDTGGTLNPTGGKAGVWFGENDFGEGVMIIDELENVYALTAKASGDREVVFGPTSSQMQHFYHRTSEDETTATSFTLAGDLPTLKGAASDTLTYNLSVENDGQQISNSATGTTTAFSMTFASLDDVPAISVADVTGDWSARTSYCATDCALDVALNFAADGTVSGSTDFNEGVYVAEITGSVAAVGNSTQYLTIDFEWNGTSRSGVVYVDRDDSTRVIINTLGATSDGGTESFTAQLTR